jgi:C-terminal processing protease CtpA/Prc
LISTAKYYSPSGKDLQANGVIPDTTVTKNANRPDLNSAESFRRRRR